MPTWRGARHQVYKGKPRPGNWVSVLLGAYNGAEKVFLPSVGLPRCMDLFNQVPSGISDQGQVVWLLPSVCSPELWKVEDALATLPPRPYIQEDALVAPTAATSLPRSCVVLPPNSPLPLGPYREMPFHACSLRCVPKPPPLLS